MKRNFLLLCSLIALIFLLGGNLINRVTLRSEGSDLVKIGDFDDSGVYTFSIKPNHNSKYEIHMINVENLSKDFKIKNNNKRVVNSLNFHINKGEIVGFIGKNGAGKSTTIKMLCGILTPTEGNIIVNSVVPYRNRKINGYNIGVVFGQKTQLWWDLPLKDSFNILRKIYKVDKEEYIERLNYFDNVFKISELLNKKVRTLSLGEKMKAEIVASLIHNPKVLYLDEPTIGLDFVSKRNMRNSIKSINERYQTTIILTTHDLEDIETLCNRIIIIDQGKIIYSGTYSEIIKKYGRNKFISIYFNSNKALEEWKSKLCKLSCITQIQENGLNIKIHTANKDALNKVYYELSNALDINDISIESDSLENIIEKIYSYQRESEENYD